MALPGRLRSVRQSSLQRREDDSSWILIILGFVLQIILFVPRRILSGVVIVYKDVILFWSLVLPTLSKVVPPIMIIWRFVVYLVLFVPRLIWTAIETLYDDVKWLVSLIAPNNQVVIMNTSGNTKIMEKGNEEISGSDSKARDQLGVAASRTETECKKTPEHHQPAASKKHAAPKQDRVTTQGILIGCCLADQPVVKKLNDEKAKKKPRRRRKAKAAKLPGKETTAVATEVEQTSSFVAKQDEPVSTQTESCPLKNTTCTATAAPMEYNNNHASARRRTRRSYNLGSYMTYEQNKQLFSKKKQRR